MLSLVGEQSSEPEAAVRVNPLSGKAGASYGLINIKSMFSGQFKSTFGYEQV
jgi:hypothetical protein